MPKGLGAADLPMPARGLCAHRGVMATHPENTLPAFREALRLGAHMIEFDVRLTRDGVLALMHDAKVDRTTNGEGRFADMTLAELRRLDAGVRKDARFAGTRIPTLEETLALMPRNVWLNCHLRTDSAELGTAAARAVEKAGRLHQAFLAARVDAADAARAAVPEVLVCYMGRQGNTVDYIDFSIARKAAFIQLRGEGEVDAGADPPAQAERGAGELLRGRHARGGAQSVPRGRGLSARGRRRAFPARGARTGDRATTPLSSSVHALQDHGQALPHADAQAHCRVAAARRCSWRAAVSARRAPEAPSGWPMAMAPPFGFTRASSKASSSSFRQPSTCAAKASLISMTSRSASGSAGPLQRLRDGQRRADAHQARRHAHRGAGQDARQRLDASRSPSARLPTSSAAAPSLMPDALPAVITPPSTAAAAWPATRWCFAGAGARLRSPRWAAPLLRGQRRPA